MENIILLAPPFIPTHTNRNMPKINRKKEPTKDQIARSLLPSILKQKKKSEKRDSLRKKREKEPLTLNRKLSLIYEYSKGASLTTLEDKYHIHRKDISKIINRHMNALANSRERLILEESKGDPKNAPTLQYSLQKLKDLELITDSFLSLLSPPTHPTLSEEEALFADLYVRTGDSISSIKDSGLDVGLVEDGPSKYKALLVRSSYLREKPNVAHYISVLKDSLFSPDNMEKRDVQKLLIEEIYRMKEKGDPRDKVNLRQTIELLGKTIGAFTERIEVQEIDPSKSLDALIEMATKAEVEDLET